MGLFGKKEDKKCCICARPANVRLSDGFICEYCRDKSSGIYLLGLGTSYKNISKAQIETVIERKNKDSELFNKFKETRSVPKKFYIDEINELWYSPLENGGKNPPVMHKFSDVMDFELQEDGTTIAKGGLGSAIVGGALFGGVGAIVGASVGGKKQKQIVQSIRINITLNDTLRPSTLIYLLPSYNKTKRNSLLYNSIMSDARTILALFNIIVERGKAPQVQNNLSVADEIKKFKELLDIGAITQEEFDTKKKELLS